MKFYTNIQLIGNQFLIRGYENGKHITHREEWKPTLFVPSERKTKYKTLEGDSVEPIQPGFVRDCREFYKKYDEVENFKIYVMTDMFINIFQKNIQKNTYSLISKRFVS